MTLVVSLNNKEDTFVVASDTHSIELNPDGSDSTRTGVFKKIYQVSNALAFSLNGKLPRSVMNRTPQIAEMLTGCISSSDAIRVICSELSQCPRPFADEIFNVVMYGFNPKPVVHLIRCFQSELDSEQFQISEPELNQRPTTAGNREAITVFDRLWDAQPSYNGELTLTYMRNGIKKTLKQTIRELPEVLGTGRPDIYVLTNNSQS